MPLVRSRYHQSKADTSTISSWLARAAVQAGYPLTNFDVSAHPLLAGQDGGIIKTAKYAKKNAKRNAKKKANKKLQRQKEEGADGQEDDAGDANDDVHDDAKLSVATPARGEVQTGEVRPSVAALPLAEVQPGSYIIRVHQYVEIAEFLVEKEVEIPIELLQLIRRCIGLRLSTLKRYLPDPDLSTYTHEYFIDVLRQVGSILHEAREAALLRKLSANSKPKTRDQPASNRFATLADFTTDDADTQDNDDQEPAVIHLEQPRNGPETAVSVAEIDFDVVDTTDEMIMDVLIFLNDIQENRSFIHKLWTKYGMGQRDLVTVSVTTNTALEVLKKTNDELMKRILPHFGGFQGLWLATIAYISERHYDRDHLDGYTWSGDVKADDLYHQHLYESLMVPTWEVMEIFTLKKNHGKGYNQYDVSKGLFNPSLNPFTMETPQRWEQARYLLEETYMDYHFIHSGLKRTQQWASHQTAHNSRPGVRPPFIDAIYEDDEMARSIGSIIDTGKCTLHDVTCAQIFVDINFILLSGTQRAHDELRQAATQMKLTIEEYQRVEAEIDGRPSDMRFRTKVFARTSRCGLRRTTS
ncbi:unnamed protein product [Tilletia controversa]|uniref:DUF6604 domain-containing protein n=1 Tax=Tilletia controversa TaxID=13291 RepID=A0A8X7MXN2_9BASI|nr:hypothetical protein CF328_g1023 [Tilletia controversa]CAD6896770.1 unnamed protein product [Tilletia laevis]KAE8251957.1 hypothetical protein A4X06_0g2473 [Tilletia controversa]CAD6926212.1 unnamed protein product [Tilletia controversa]CAD6946257.1 unnamed protein product [Tilletia controversa]